VVGAGKHAAQRVGRHLANGRAHGVELVVAGNLLHQLAVVFKAHEVAQVVQQVSRPQRTPPSSSTWR
jgi:aromatic ring-opening dioxygenase catalytic subunit (LigB family)